MRGEVSIWGELSSPAGPVGLCSTSTSREKAFGGAASCFVMGHMTGRVERTALSGPNVGYKKCCVFCMCEATVAGMLSAGSNCSFRRRERLSAAHISHS